MIAVVRRRFSLWLKKRIPAGNEQTLSHQKIFIFPSLFGWCFLVLCGLLFILGTNYQNNLMRLLCTFLLSLFLLHLFVSYINFARLRIKALPHQPSFAQDSGSLPVQFSHRRKPVQGIIHLSWWRSEIKEVAAVLLDDNPTVGIMPYVYTQRGVHTLPRLTLRCDYPLGLFKCWTHLDLAQTAVVYPMPSPCPVRLISALDGTHDNTQTKQGGFDEFHSLREFQPSDGLSTVAWKHAAKSGSWLVKLFEQPDVQSGWLGFASCEGTTTEQRLSELCFQIIELSKHNAQFGLDIPGVHIAQNTGEAHKHQCLKALATYPITINGGGMQG